VATLKKSPREEREAQAGERTHLQHTLEKPTVKFGEFEIAALRLENFKMDGGAMFGIVPRKLWTRSYPHFDDDGRIDLTAYAFLVRGRQRTIIIDSGIGQKLEQKTQRIFDLNPVEAPLTDALAHHNIAPGDVTDVILTHLHFDHSGGVTAFSPQHPPETARSTAPQPVFPNARYFIQADHLARARNPSDKDRASFMPRNFEPLADCGVLQQLDGGGEFLPGMELRIVHGHTRAMQMVIINGDIESPQSELAGCTGCIFLIDLVPTAAHLPFHYVGAVDNYPLEALEEKRKIESEIFERKLVCVFGHDPYTPAATLQPAARGFEILHPVKI
jgi:glyoxylase-like metal-dependent hydrolase (beta-lactamase superfamily II)